MPPGRLRSLARRALGRVPIDYRRASEPDPGPEPLCNLRGRRGPRVRGRRRAGAMWGEPAGPHGPGPRPPGRGPGRARAGRGRGGRRPPRGAWGRGGAGVPKPRATRLRGERQPGDGGVAPRRDPAEQRHGRDRRLGGQAPGRGRLVQPAVATVTPFSNNATICSLPELPEPNPIPAGLAIDDFAAPRGYLLAARVPPHPHRRRRVPLRQAARPRRRRSLRRGAPSASATARRTTSACGP